MVQVVSDIIVFLLCLVDKKGFKNLAQGYVSSSNYGIEELRFHFVSLKLMTFISYLFYLSHLLADASLAEYLCLYVRLL